MVLWATIGFRLVEVRQLEKQLFSAGMETKRYLIVLEMMPLIFFNFK